MKVLLVDQFGKTTGRDTLALAELLNESENIEMEVCIADTTEFPNDRKYTLKVSKGFSGAYEGNAINKAINYLKALWKLNKYINRNNIDVVHLQWFSLPWIEWIYVSMLRKRHKVVITVHDIIPFDKRPMEMRALNKIYSEADTLIMHTESGKKLFTKTYSAKTPISVVSQGFCRKADYTRIDKVKAKAHFGILEDTIVFLYYGTIRQSKGLDILIKAIHDAYKVNNKIYLLAAGAFHKVNEEYYKKLVDKQLSESYSTINFGFVPQAEEQWYFSAADVLCLPYLEVTQSGVAQLGLMYELPMIASHIGEMSDVCRNSKNGYLIPAGNQQMLRDVICKISSNSKTLKEFSIKSKELGEREFSLENKANKIVKVYNSLMG